MMDKFAVDESDAVESKAVEIKKTASSIDIADARELASKEINKKPGE